MGSALAARAPAILKVWMLRTLAFLVILTHLSVVSIPCVGTGSEVDVATSKGTPPSHHHAALGMDHDHADRRGVEMTPASSSMAAKAVVPPELRAPCLCGCSESSNLPGTTTSSRLGFALFPPRPTPLPEPIPSQTAAEIDLMPVPVADPLDHVPIPS